MSRLEDTVRTLVLLVAAVIGAAIGFTHSRAWAESNGQHGLLGVGTAVMIELIVVIAGLELRRRFGLLPVLVLVAGITVQMVSQVAEAPPTWSGWLVACVPSLGFLAIVKLVLRGRSVKGAAETLAAAPTQVQSDQLVHAPGIGGEIPQVRELLPSSPDIDTPLTPAPSEVPALESVQAGAPRPLPSASSGWPVAWPSTS